MERITVAAAVISDNGRVLIARRKDEGRHPGKWEFPGGKVEKGETLEECVAREMNEEMGVQIRVGDKLAEIHHQYEDLEVQLILFNCEITSGETSNLGCSEHVWEKPEKLSEYDLLPPDREILPTLL